MIVGTIIIAASVLVAAKSEHSLRERDSPTLCGLALRLLLINGTRTTLIELQITDSNALVK